MSLNVLITGANSGFGLLATRTLAEAGHTVHAGYRNPEKTGPLKALADEGLPIHPVKLDVTETADIASAVAAASGRSPIDVLVNNAGFAVSGPVEVLSDQMLSRQFNTNVLGPVRLMRAVAPGMRARGTGRIINVSSIAGILGAPFEGAYAASKHAIEGLTEAMWYEIRPFGVHVSLIEPGFFPTEFSDNIVHEPAYAADSPYRAVEARFQQGLAGMRGAGADPQRVADAILEAATSPDPKLRYVVGDDATMMNGLYRGNTFEAWASAMMTQLGLGDLMAAPTA